jgi:hypothetical protein
MERMSDVGVTQVHEPTTAAMAFISLTASA